MRVREAMADLRRLAAVHATGLLDSPPDAAFDRLARLAAHLLRAPVGLVSLLDDRRQYYCGSFGRPEGAPGETPLAATVCQYVVEDDAPFVVEDARTHERLRGSPALATGLVAYAGAPLRTSAGEVIGTVCVTDTRPRAWTPADLAALTDLADGAMSEIDLRRVGRRLREQEQQHAELLDQTHELVVVSGPDGMLSYANRAWRQAMGYSAEEVRGLRAVDLVAPEHRGRYVEAARRLLGGDTIADIELVLIAKDGSRHVMRGGATVSTRNGAVVSTRAFYRDVTRERQGEALGARLVATIDATPDLVAIATRTGRLVYLNRAGKALIGLPEDAELTAVTMADLFTEEEMEQLTDQIIPLALWRGTWEGEATLVAKGGEHIPVSLVLVAHPSMRDDDDSPYFLSVLMRDLRSRARTEARLRESELRFRSVLERVQTPALIATPDRRVAFANSFLLDLVGLSRAEVEGASLSTIVPGEASVTPEMIARGDVPEHVETDLLGRGGERRRVAWDAVVLHDERGEVAGIAAVGQDVTERRRVEALKDQVIAIVGHELRSPIGAVRGALQLLAKRLPALGPREQQLFDMAVRNTDRSLQLASDLLDYERLDAGAAPMDCAVHSAAALLAHAQEVVGVAAETASVRLDVEGGAAEVWVDASRMVQVLVNLAGNAIKFSPPDGVVHLSARREDDRVVFRVADQGRGIPADQLDAVFDRFTQVHKSDAKRGSGLGLAIARAIVRQHRGRIWVESEEGRGSTFLVSLPTAEAALGGSR